MRIISGQYKGLRLLEPDRDTTRPTSDKVRQAVFNILEHSVLERNFKGLSVLDAFAGSGALGLEALSRGAKKCLFVEQSKTVARVLIKNIKTTVKNAEEVDVNILCKDVSNLVAAQYFDLVFIDPPFKKIDLYLKLILKLKQQGVVDSHTIFYTESNRQINSIFDEAILPIRQLSSRQFGEVEIAFWRLR